MIGDERNGSLDILLCPTPIDTLERYLATGGGRALERAVELGPDRTLLEVRTAGIRGRGGAGFPTARKWEGVRSQPGPRYVVGNGAEGEPGVFKDRALLRSNPYQVIEGLVIAGFVVEAAEGFVCTKAAYGAEADGLERAAAELQAAGMCEVCSITIVRGPDAYLFGEETALLEVVESRPPLPRILPPYEHGLFAGGPTEGWEPSRRASSGSNPTVVNNVETLSHVTHVLRHGADWFLARGTEASPGTTICTVVGDVERPGVAEVALGTPLDEVIEQIGGDAQHLPPIKAVLSGVANPVLTGDALRVPVSYEGFAAVGSGMGAAGFIVYREDACMVEVARQVSRFLAVESCGQCLPCKEGSRVITAHLERLEAGVGNGDDIAEMERWLRQVTDSNRCYLAVQEQVTIASLLRAFPEEFAAHLDGTCPRPRPLPFPKLIDLDGTGAVVDEGHANKRADWTMGDHPVLLGPP